MTMVMTAIVGRVHIRMDGKCRLLENGVDWTGAAHVTIVVHVRENTLR